MASDLTALPLCCTITMVSVRVFCMHLVFQDWQVKPALQGVKEDFECVEKADLSDP